MHEGTLQAEEIELVVETAQRVEMAAVLDNMRMLRVEKIELVVETAQRVEMAVVFDHMHMLRVTLAKSLPGM